MTTPNERLAAEWFPNHKATITQSEHVTILDWKNPSTGMYAIQYVLLGNTLFITGDVGDAVFRMTGPVTLESFKSQHIDYFLEKMTAHSGDRWRYNSKQAQIDLDNWYTQYGDSEDYDLFEELEHLMDDISNIIRSSESLSEYTHRVYNHYDDEEFEYFDSEDFSIIAEFGHTLPDRFNAYLLGLQMAYAQLSSNEKEGSI